MNLEQETAIIKDDVIIQKSRKHELYHRFSLLLIGAVALIDLFFAILTVTQWKYDMALALFLVFILCCGAFFSAIIRRKTKLEHWAVYRYRPTQTIREYVKFALIYLKDIGDGNFDGKYVQLIDCTSMLEDTFNTLIDPPKELLQLEADILAAVQNMQNCLVSKTSLRYELALHETQALLYLAAKWKNICENTAV